MRIPIYAATKALQSMPVFFNRGVCARRVLTSAGQKPPGPHEMLGFDFVSTHFAILVFGLLQRITWAT
jgi:hypothetical protein